MTDETLSKRQELIDALRTARDTARVQAHLFSLDAKQRWQELEGKILNAEAKLEHAGNDLGESISTTAAELVRAVKEALEELTKTETAQKPPGK
jgi:hypothetical protein